MSLTAIVWIILFVTLSLMTLQRSSWGFALYLLTFYAMPILWWWGDGFLTSITVRWNLIAALIFAIGVLLDSRPHRSISFTSEREVKLLVFYAINALLVHFLLASNVIRSWNGVDLILKQLGLFILLVASARDRTDLKIVIVSIILGSAYVGYEVVINDRGGLNHGRLEGMIITAAGDANLLAGLLALALPLAGWFIFTGRRLEKLAMIAMSVLVLETIIRCNSRGAFLALICGGIWLVVTSRSYVRRYALVGVALAVAAALFLAKDPEILSRFMTTFAPAEERDASAQSRIEYWQLGAKMIGDYPLGSGAEAAFKSARGLQYLRTIGESEIVAIHNGFLDIAASWGVQGFLLYLTTIWLAWRGVGVTMRRYREKNDVQSVFLGNCLQAALVIQLVACMFISSLDGEWFFWWIGIALIYRRVCSSETATAAEETAENDEAPVAPELDDPELDAPELDELEPDTP